MADLIAMVVTSALDGDLAGIVSVDTIWGCAKWWAAAHIARETIDYLRRV